MFLWILFSCQQKLTSPPVTIESSDANLVCNDQLTTHIQINGSNFAPLPIGVLGDNAGLQPPELWLERANDAYTVGADTVGGSDTGSTPSNMASLNFSLTEYMTWTSDSLLEVDIRPDYQLPSGAYTLHVRNPNGETAEAPAALTIVDPPHFASIDPLMVCVDSRSQVLSVHGENFLFGEDLQPSLAVAEGDSQFTLEPSANESCTELNGVTEFSVCDDLEFTFADGSLSPGLHDAWLTNPSPASCSTVMPITIEAVERPHVDDVVANFECVQQGDQRVTIHGSHFILLPDGTTPMVSFGSYQARADLAKDCQALPGAAQAQTCSTLELTLPEDVQEPGVFTIVVTNPAPVDCDSSEEVQIELLPRPSVTLLTENLECSQQEDQSMSIQGSGFLRLADGTTPMVQVGSVLYPTTTDNCSALTGPQGGETCTDIQFTLPMNASVGVHDVVVINPNSSECISEESVQLEVVPAPSISGFTEQLESIEQADQNMHVVGSGFVQLADGTNPTITLNNQVISTVTLSNCTALQGPAGGQTCTDIDFVLSQNLLPVDIYDIQVQNPQPAYCVTEESIQIELIGRPHADTLSEEMTCLDQSAQQYTITGSNFLRSNDQVMPTVTVGSYTTSATELRDCVDLQGPMGGLLCSTLHFLLPVDAEVSGVHSVVVTNPSTAEAYSEETRLVEITHAPTVSTIVENLQCIDQSDKTFNINGSGFIVLADGTTPAIRIGSETIQADSGNNCQALTGPQGGQVCAQLTVTLTEDHNASSLGVHDVVVTNPIASACYSEESRQIEVVPAPSISGFTEQLESIEQADQNMHVVGSGFVQLADGTNPTITLNNQVISTVTLSNCTALQGPAGGQTCTDIDFVLSQNLLPVDIYDIQVQNPQPAYCITEESVQIELIGRPHADTLSEEMTCLDQMEQQYTITGSNFLRSNDQVMPTVTVGSYTTSATELRDCVDLQGPMGGLLCSTLDFTLPVSAEISGVHSVVVTNPSTAEAYSEETRLVEITNAPTVTTISENLQCIDQSDKTFNINGSGFIVLADGTTPLVQLGGDVISADTASNCQALTGPQGGEICTDITVTLTQDQQDAGIYGVVVHNPYAQTCASTEGVEYEIIAQPVLTDISEEVDCVEQAERPLVLTGQGFLRTALLEVPDITVGGNPVLVDSMDNCSALQGPQGGELCETISIILPQNVVLAGLHDIAVTNPVVDCAIEEVFDIEIIPAPITTNIVESMECLAETAQDIVIYGDTFYIPASGGYPMVFVDGTEETVVFADGCSPLNTGGQVCSQLHVTLAMGSYSAGTHDVQVYNIEPGQCSSNLETLNIADVPVLSSSLPLSVCVAQNDQSISLQGSYLLANNGTGELPTVEILGTTFLADSVGGCSPSLLDGNFDECATVDVTLSAGSIPAGNHTITLHNPEPADCSVSSIELEVFPAPIFSGSSATLSCIDQEDITLTLYGSDFLEINGNIPSVSVGGTPVTVNSLDYCTSVPGSAASRTCKQMNITIAQGSLLGGSHFVTIQNPAGGDCQSEETIQIDLVGVPRVTEVRPSSACYESPNTISVEIIGTSFIQFADGSLPSVMLGNVEYQPTQGANCAPLGNTGTLLCDSLFIDVDLNQFNAPQSLAMQVINPPEIGCNSNSNFTFELTGPPTIISVEDSRVCDDGRTVLITGTEFTNTSVVELNGAQITSNYIDSEHIEIPLPVNYGEGIYDVVVRNVDQCFGESTNALEIVSSPLPFFVDPQVIYNGINLQVTLYASDINDGIAELYIEDSNAVQTPVSYTYNVSDPNRVYFTVPAGLPKDTYSVYIRDVLDCGNSLAGAFFIEDTLTVSIESIDPAFGSTLDYTSVEVTSDPNQGDTFQDVPRLYLNPMGNGLATELFGINYQHPELLDAIIPDGLTPGMYDLIAVNPDGGVGLLSNAIEVLNERLPLISGISPGSFDTSATGLLTVLGDNLDLADAYLECTSSLGAQPVIVDAFVVGGSSTAYQIQVDMNDADITGGLVCIVEVQNNSGALARYSSVSVTTPSGNLAQFYTGPNMLQARRGAPSAVGRATYSARYLYVMGGDQGFKNTSMNSIEYAQVDRYGQLQQWRYLPNTLPLARSLTTSVTIGRYIYLPAGNDGNAPTTSVHRAQVLDPLESPRITNVDLNLEANSVLSAGTWVYRVAASYPVTYDDNPGGESLASDPFVIRLPNIGESLSVTLEWSAVPHASQYRVYRSPFADAGSGAEELLAVVTNGTSFTDLGVGTSANIVPLPQGALGNWAELPDLNTGRESPCIAKARHPTDPSKYFIYVAGGEDANGNKVNTIEYLEVTEVNKHDHEVSASWTVNPLRLAVARSECGSFVVDNESNQFLPSDTLFVYFGPGKNAAGGVSKYMEAGQVAQSGELYFTGETQNLYTVSSNAFSVMGYYYGTAGGYLYAFGGNTGNQIRNAGISSKLCGDELSNGVITPICNNGDLPDTQGWNNLGISMNQKRYLPSVTQESSIFFILGGESDTQTATNTVDWIYY